jgi:Tol biopolymer transport system component
MGDFAVSPDGRRIAFVAASKSGSSLWVRSFAAVDPRPIAGTDGARNPFWSPDSQSIGFFANNQLKTVPAGGESPVESSPWSMTFPLAAETGGHAPMGTWNSKGVIVFGPASDGNLYQVGVNENRTPSLVPTGGRVLGVARRFSLTVNISFTSPLGPASRYGWRR